MPHIIVTSPPQFKPTADWKTVLIALSNRLAELNATFALSDCKARLITAIESVVGDGSIATDHPVIAIDIKVMPGRPESVLCEIGPAIRDEVARFLPANSSPIEITVDVQELGGPRYSKIRL